MGEGPDPQVRLRPWMERLEAALFWPACLAVPLPFLALYWMSAVPHDHALSRALRLGLTETQVRAVATFEPAICDADDVRAWEAVTHLGPLYELNVTRNCLRARTESIWVVGGGGEREPSCSPWPGDSLLGFADGRVVWLMRSESGAEVEEAFGCSPDPPYRSVWPSSEPD